jgi:hypothetical protein
MGELERTKWALHNFPEVVEEGSVGCIKEKGQEQFPCTGTGDGTQGHEPRALSVVIDKPSTTHPHP